MHVLWAAKSGLSKVWNVPHLFPETRGPGMYPRSEEGELVVRVGKD
jgi:hypothetical protein